MTLYAGLISGTSMDGVDAALVAFGEGGVTTVATHSAAIPDTLKHELHALAQDPSVAALRFWNADAQLGSVFADAVLGLLEIAGVDAREVTAIGSHGQTVYHAPRAATPLTVQIGDPSIIAERTGITTVADFRRRDIAGRRRGSTARPGIPPGRVLGSRRRALHPQSGRHREPVGPARGPRPTDPSDSTPDPRTPSSIPSCAAGSAPTWIAMPPWPAKAR